MMSSDIEYNAQAVIEHLTAQKHKAVMERDDLIDRLRQAQHERDKYKTILEDLQAHYRNDHELLQLAINERSQIKNELDTLRAQLKAVISIEPPKEGFPELEKDHLVKIAVRQSVEIDQLRAKLKAAQEQEPVAYWITGDNVDIAARNVNLDELAKLNPSWKCSPLYSAPVQKSRPAPCEHNCEAKAFDIEIRQLKAQIKESEEDYEYLRDEGVCKLIDALNVDVDGDEAEPHLLAKFLQDFINDYIVPSGVTYVIGENGGYYQSHQNSKPSGDDV